VVSGQIVARVAAVGVDSYAGRMVAEAKRYSLTGSELMDGINRILKWMLVALILIGPVLFARQISFLPWRAAVRSSVAGLVGMIPEGLVLLTTLAFLAASIRLGRRGVLVQELPAVEGLARVDCLCTDKTGTLTEGTISWERLIMSPGDRSAPVSEKEVRSALAALADAQPANATSAAIAGALGPAPAWSLAYSVPFSSERKWSAAGFRGGGTWVMGAPEILSRYLDAELSEEAQAVAATGGRVLAVGRSDQAALPDALPSDLHIVALVCLRERLRPDAAQTLRYFADQGVTVKVVSGDSALTVGAVAKQVALPDSDKVVDTRSWPAEPAGIMETVERNAVFARVTPQQKREMVDALRRRGHVVAMTGDGVNDTLALKEADLGIAMGSGAAVAQGVAKLVLIRNQFSLLPSVVSEGRRVLRNIETVAVLFLVKNFYSVGISIAVAIFGWPYPFLPRHLTLVSGLAIGIPAFFLALGPGGGRFEKGFTRRVVTFAALLGGITAVAVLIVYGIARSQGSDGEQARTAAVSLVIVTSLWLLLVVSRPWRLWKLALIGAVACAFAVVYVTPGLNTFFSVNHRPSSATAITVTVVSACACAAISVAALLTTRRRRTHLVAPEARHPS
jgi:cation-transporting ATPase E